VKLLEAFIMRDRAIKEAIYNSFPPSKDLIDVIETAFKTGTRDFEQEYLPTTFSQGEVKEFYAVTKEAPEAWAHMRGEDTANSQPRSVAPTIPQP
jgi:hypothetical protein